MISPLPSQLYNRCRRRPPIPIQSKFFRVLGLTNIYIIQKKLKASKQEAKYKFQISTSTQRIHVPGTIRYYYKRFERPKFAYGNVGLCWLKYFR